MKSLMMLWTKLAEELGEQCGASTALDQKTVEGRVKNQGWSYMTISLPQFCKDFEKSLADEVVDLNLFIGFKMKGRTPQFLGGFLDLIFDRGTGTLLPEPSIDSIQAVRQLTLLYAKLELPTSEKREAAAMRGFVETENQVLQMSESLGAPERDDFKRMSRLLWAGVLTEVDSRLWKEQGFDGSFDPDGPYLYPKHGPGATADRLRGNAKFNLTEWHQRLEEEFPFGIYLSPNEHEDNLSEVHDRVSLVRPEDERPVRVVAVPKTQKTPRIIAIEPSCMQYMQQALSSLIVERIVKDNHILAGAFVGFQDQNANRRMAQEGSLTGSLATLDLSEASDRVSWLLVQDLLHRWPHTLRAVDATRSRTADVQGHGVIPLAKFASMGSALTFPIEAMVFLTIVFLGIEKARCEPVTRQDLTSYLSRVIVYGDDIIVPTECAPSVIQSLETYGLIVNRSKSFWTGKFRESCGREFYDGHDVSVVKVRKVVSDKTGRLSFPTSLKHVSEIESFVALRNRFYAAGRWTTARYLDEQIEPLLRGFYPAVEVTEQTPEEEAYSRSRLLGRWSFLGYQSEWTHPTLHCPMVRGWVVSDRIPKSNLEGVGALQKVLSKRSDEPFADRRHLERAGRPEAVYMKLRRVAPF